MIAASQVIDLFGETGPSGPGYVGGDYPENAIVYYPGGYGSLREVSRMIQEAGPSGLAQAGGSRSQSRKKRLFRRTKSAKSRKNNKKSRRSRNRR